ncbi:MAG: DUF4145 domain-containing protein [Acidobacteriota bacterium]
MPFQYEIAYAHASTVKFRLPARTRRTTAAAGRLAERYFAEDPNTCLLAASVCRSAGATAAARSGLRTGAEETQFELVRRLQDQGIVPREVFQLFDRVRWIGNNANHALQGNHADALDCLKLCRQLAVWFHRNIQGGRVQTRPVYSTCCA